MTLSIVTGAGGFVGSHLLDTLLASGREVIAVDCKPLEQWAGVRDGRNYDADACRILDRMDLAADCSGGELSERLPERAEEVFHLAALARIQPSFREPARWIRNNASSTLAMADYARRAGAKLVFAGSSTCDGDAASSPYALSKSLGEQICDHYRRLYGVRTAVTRFYNVYGPRQIEAGPGAQALAVFRRQYRDGEPLTVTGDGGQRRDFTHVSDLCRGLIAVAESDGRGPIALGTGRNYSLLEVARMFVPSERIVFLDRPPGEAEVTLASADETERAIGWRAEIQLPDYVRDWRRSLDPQHRGAVGSLAAGTVT
ncbi:MAG: NAD-dependent epimerase/dehydratase family protein [Pirellulaceae bacterium]